jgi:hypothetical protein
LLWLSWSQWYRYRQNDNPHLEWICWIFRTILCLLYGWLQKRLWYPYLL